jgi:hypothetical protein
MCPKQARLSPTEEFLRVGVVPAGDMSLTPTRSPRVTKRTRVQLFIGNAFLDIPQDY